MSFATLVANLNLNISNFASQLQAAQTQVNQFTNNLNARLNTGFAEPAKKAKFEFKDVARIVQGIMISKVFYSGMNAIRDATGAVIDFQHQLEQARVSYTALFRDAGLATEFINVLQDFAARTPVSFGEAEKVARKLAAFSIPAENMMFMMEGITAAASAMGTPTALEAITRALGQMYTKGRVVQQELNQLTEAGIPVYDILREKLGLTAKEFENIAKAGIPANEAINALVEGMTERYGKAMEYTAKTLPGIVAQIKDNLLIIMSDLTKPVYEAVRTSFAGVLEKLVELRQALQSGGIGGLFEALFPPELHATIRQIVGGLGTIVAMVHQLWISLGPLRQALNEAFVKTLALIIPIIAAVIGALTALVRIFFQNATVLQVLSSILVGAAAAWLLFKAAALGAMALQGLISVIMGIAKAVLFLGTVLVTNPILGILMLMVGVMAGLAVSSSKAGESIRGFISNMQQAMGLDTSKLILPSQKERTAELDKFNKRLGGTNQALDDLANNSKKAMKGLMSFDEVYRLTAPEDSGLGDSLDDLLSQFEDLEFPEIEMPDFGGFATDFVNNFIDAIKDRFMKAGLGAIIGGIFGAIIGGILGDPILGAKIGAFAGGLVGLFWDEITKAFGLSDTEAIAALIAGMIGAIIGAVLGGPLGALIGGALGLLAGTLGKMLWDKLAEVFGLGPDAATLANITALIGAAIGAIIGGILGGPVGALIGAAIGYFAGGFVGLFWDKIKEAFGLTDRQGIALAIGATLGAIIGGLIGGPVGALLGAPIGALVGWVVEQIITGFETGEWDFVSIGLPLGAAIGAAIGLIAGGPGGAIIGGAIGALVGWVGGLIVEGFTTGEWNWQEIALPLATLIGTAIGFIAGGPLGAAIGAAIGFLVGWVGQELIKGFQTGDWDPEMIGVPLGTLIGAGIGFIAGGPLGAAIGAALGALVGWLFGSLITKINEGSEQAKAQLGGSIGAILGGAIGFFIGGPLGAVIGVLVGGILGALIGGWDEMINYFATYATENFLNKLGEIWGWVAGFFDTTDKQWWEIGRDIVLGIFAGIGGAVATVGIALWDYLVAPIIDGIKYLFGIKSPATTMFPVGEMIVKGIFQGISDFMGWLIESIGGFVGDIVGACTQWTVDTAEAISGWVTDTVGSIGDWASQAGEKISTWVTDKAGEIGTWATDTAKNVKTWATDTGKDISGWVSDTAKGISGWVKDRASEFTGWTADTAKNISGWVKDTTKDIGTWATDTGKTVTTWTSERAKSIATWVTDTAKNISDWTSNTAKDVVNWSSTVGKNITDWTTNTKRDITTWIGDTALGIGTWVTDRATNFTTFMTDSVTKLQNMARDGKTAISDFTTNTASSVGTWFTNTLNSLTTWASDMGRNISNAFNTAKTNITNFFTDVGNKLSSGFNLNVSGLSGGHATGGVFNREHVARFAEGNKAEAIIPLEERGAMQPFVDAVANGLARLLPNNSPQPAFAGGADERPILYVGTLIADDRSLQELERRMNVVRLQEGRRVGADLTEDRWNSN